MYQYIHEDDENTFQLVDSTRLPKPAYQKRTRFQQNVRSSAEQRASVEFSSPFSAFSSTTNSKWSIRPDAKGFCRDAEEIENDEKFRNVTSFPSLHFDPNRLSLARRDQMRQMRKWQKQYGNRADPRQHVILVQTESESG